jgi:hypothetical protein
MQNLRSDGKEQEGTKGYGIKTLESLKGSIWKLMHLVTRSRCFDEKMQEPIRYGHPRDG